MVEKGAVATGFPTGTKKQTNKNLSGPAFPGLCGTVKAAGQTQLRTWSGKCHHQNDGEAVKDCHTSGPRPIQQDSPSPVSSLKPEQDQTLFEMYWVQLL